jgi:hypothetical protein
VRPRHVLLLVITSLSFGLAIGIVFFSSADLGVRLAIAGGAALGAFALSVILRKRASPVD